jgi:DNA-directed RNA polymerase II subunit RPB1
MIDGQPVHGGANDPLRVGSIHDTSDPGYFGHLELVAKPVYHQGFVTVTNKALSLFAIIVVVRMRILRSKRKCDHCQGVQPIYTKTDLHLTVDFPDDGGSKQTLSGETVAVQ